MPAFVLPPRHTELPPLTLRKPARLAFRSSSERNLGESEAERAFGTQGGVYASSGPDRR